MRLILIPTVLALSCFVVCATPALAELDGETINIDRVIPSLGFDYDVFVGQSGAYTVGVSAPLSLSEGNNDYASATDTDLIVDFGPGPGSGGGYADHAIVFSDLLLGTGTVITGFDVVTDTVPGIDSGDISFDGHSVTIGIGDAGYSGGQVLDIQLQTSAAQTPEPGTLLSMIAALGASGLALACKRPLRHR